jgi:hypothetical protein
VGVGEEIVADGDSAIDDDVGQEDGVVSDYYVFVDHYVGAEVRVLAQLGFGMNYRGGMDSGGIAGRLVEKFYGLGPGQIWVLAAQHSGVNGGKVFGYDDRRGFVIFAAALYLGLETKVSWPGRLFYAGYGGDFGVGRGVFEAGV